MTVDIHDPASVPAPAAAPPAAAPAAPETPTQRVVRAANTVNHIVDAGGRSLGWKKLSTLEEFDFLELCGASAGNQPWLIMALCAQAVVEINGDPVARPANKAQLRARVQLLGDDGIAAVQKALMPTEEDGAPPTAELDRAKN